MGYIQEARFIRQSRATIKAFVKINDKWYTNQFYGWQLSALATGLDAGSITPTASWSPCQHPDDALCGMPFVKTAT